MNDSRPTTLPLSQSNTMPGFQAKVATNGVVDKEITRLRETHELYKIYAPEWEMYLAFYEGGPEAMSPDHLFKHQRENTEDYNDRCKRLHYFNYCEPLVDFFTNFIFTETIERSGGTSDAWYLEFIADVNKKGDTITDYMKMVSDDMQIFGMSWTLVDTPAIPGLSGGGDGEGSVPVTDAVLTKQQEEEQGIRPYWVLIKPEEVLDWELNDFDIPVYMKRVQYLSRHDSSGSLEVFEKYTEWWPTKTVVSMVDVTSREQPKLVSTPTEYANTLGIIPLKCTRYKRSKRYPFMGNSFLRDFAYNNREIMNYTSTQQEFLYRQCFNVLAKESDTAIPLRDQNDGNIGQSNVLEYPKGANPPQYISPPVAPAKFISEERQRIVVEMFKRASQDMLSELFNGEKSSGFSQAQSFSKTVPFIATRADTLEKSEVNLMSLTMMMVGKKWDGKIKYKDRYELTNIQDAITQLMQIFRDLYIPSETFVKEELKRLVHELDGKITPDRLAVILKEIEDMDFEEWQGVQKLALIGNAGQSPAAQQVPKQSGTIAEAAGKAQVKTSGASKKLKNK